MDPQRCARLALTLGPARTREQLSSITVPVDAVQSWWPRRGEHAAWRGARDPADLLLRCDRELERLARRGATVLLAGDPTYPSALTALPGAPAALYVWGELPGCPLVGVVGSRAARAAGLALAREVARELWAAGHGVISGGAIGIDGAAHEGALEAGAPTVAVLGSGLDHLYPERHVGLFHRIASGGAVISQFPSGTPPRSWQFPRRNVLIAALSRALLVVEAQPRSGALITASLAGSLGVPLLACDGSAGARRLLQQGAGLVGSAGDVKQVLAGAPPRRLTPRVGEDGEAALAALPEGSAASIDEVAARLGWGVARAAAALLRLELCGAALLVAGGRYARTAPRG